MKKDRSRSRSRESGGKPDDSAAKLREQAAAIAAAAWIMSGFELSADPVEKTTPEEPEKHAHTDDTDPVEKTH